jgi:hypothetical protein
MFHNRVLNDLKGAKRLVREHLLDLDVGWTELAVQTTPPVTLWLYGEAPDSITLMMDESGMIGDYHPIDAPEPFGAWLVRNAIPFRRMPAGRMVEMFPNTPCMLVAPQHTE